MFYGLCKRWRQLLPVEIFAKTEQKDVHWDVPYVEIVDQPRFAWRGFMLDGLCGIFRALEFVKRLIDLMAMHKLNLLHWHLSDDDGFRIKIKSYPKLTEVGGWRGTECKLPNTQRGEKFARYGGFYTQEQIRDIVAYAAARHINILPEIDMPGHSGAAATAYPEILCEGKHTGHVWCSGREENYQMLDAIVGELAELFPFEYIHIGGDEVNHQAWAGCPRCKALMNREKFTSLSQLQGYFIRRYEKILSKHGRKMIGWEEIANDGLSRDSAIVAWHSGEPGYKALAAGRDVVFAPGPFCYFDMKESARDTWGHTWAGHRPLVESLLLRSVRPAGADREAEIARVGRAGLSVDRVHHLPRTGRLQDLAAAMRPGRSGLDSAVPPQFHRVHGSPRSGAASAVEAIGRGVSRARSGGKVNGNRAGAMWRRPNCGWTNRRVGL